MKLLWLGLGAAAAYVLLKKDETSASSTVLTPTPVPGLTPTRTCAEWEAYSKSCNEPGMSCQAWVGPVPQGCLPELTGGVQAASQAQAFPPLTAAGLTLSPPQVVDVGRDPPCFRSEMLASNGKCYPIFFGA